MLDIEKYIDINFNSKTLIFFNNIFKCKCYKYF